MRCPSPGPPVQACPAGGSVAPNAEGRAHRRRPAKATGASWVPEPRSSSPHWAGRHPQRRWGGCSRGESVLTPMAQASFLRPAGPCLRLGLWVPAAGKLGPAVSAAAESRAQKPERPRARLGKGRGRHRLRRPAVETLELGSPAPPQAGEPPAAWPLIVGKLDAPGKVQLVEGGLRFPLLNFPGLPGRPPPPFLTRL